MTETKGIPKKELVEFIQWCWMLDARPSGLATLRKENITMMNDETLTILWTEDKRAKQTGPYSTRVGILPRWKNHVMERLNRAQHSHLFPSIVEQYKKAVDLMRTTGLRFRALRRGPIQALAQSGMEIGEIKKLSGHKTDQSLMTYLNYGRAIKRNTETWEAARELL
jgi:integrase